MIIKFGNIELSNWTKAINTVAGTFPTHWCRTYESGNGAVIVVSVKELPNEADKYYAMFYHQFSVLHEAFPPNFQAKDIHIAKEYVDNFLIKMSRLTAFL